MPRRSPQVPHRGHDHHQTRAPEVTTKIPRQRDKEKRDQKKSYGTGGYGG